MTAGRAMNTPWGPADRLRDRRLNAGPKKDRDVVERNHRDRLYAAMCACVAERGLCDTRVADVVELSGVSRQGFYNLFEDRDACFLAMLDEALAKAAADFTVEPGIVGVRNAGVQAIEYAATYPGVGYALLVASYSAGAEGMKRHDKFLAAVERAAMKHLSWEGLVVPRELVPALVEGVAAVVRSRLLRGGDVKGDGVDALEWALSFAGRGPTQLLPTRILKRDRVPYPADLLDKSHEGRVRTAVLRVVSESGYSASTVAAIAKRARVSNTTFYEVGGDKAKALERAIRAELTVAREQAAEAMKPHRWPTSVAAGIRAVFLFLAARPDLGRCMTTEAYAAGPAVARMVDGELDALTAPFLPPAEVSRPGQVAQEATLGAVRGLVRRNPDRLRSRIPLATYIALAPSIGSAARAPSPVLRLVAQPKPRRRNGKMAMTDEQFEAKVKELRDKGFDVDDPVREYKDWTFGTRVRAVSNADEDTGVYDGDEGYLGLERVGSAERGTERVQPVLYGEHHSEGLDVSLDNIEPVD
jgi:AcrR family transcriptional regulator